MTDDNPDYSVGDVVRFTDPHHAMNSSLKSHEGDLGVIDDTDRGYNSDKELVLFFEGTSKKVVDSWSIKSDRLTPATDGPWKFACGMCGETFVIDESFRRCVECGAESLRLEETEVTDE